MSFNDPALITEVVDFEYGKESAGFSYPEHLHPFHQLDVVLSGEVDIGVEGGDWKPVRSGKAVLIPPLLRHQFHSKDGFLSCTFKLSLSSFYWPLIGEQVRTISPAQCLLTMLADLGKQLHMDTAVGRETIMAVGTLCLALNMVKTTHAVPRPGTDRFREQLWKVLARIHAYPGNEWSVTMMASECRISPNRFTERFQAMLNMRPLEYVQQVRMHAAAALLVNESETPVKAIVNRVGYTSLQSFTRSFSRCMGISPAAYRDAPRRF